MYVHINVIKNYTEKENIRFHKIMNNIFKENGYNWLNVIAEIDLCKSIFYDTYIDKEKDTEKMYAELINSISLVDNEKIKILLTNIFNDPIISEKFKKHPGAIEIHHNWIGGLLEHTLEVLKYSQLTLQQFPMLDKDLLIAGSLLHDIGKLDELEVTSRIKGTNKGQLTGHLILGIIYVAQRIDEIADFDKTIKDKILHILTSHHGKNEFGSPKEPMFPEALAIYYADELSSKISEMTEFIESAKEETEDDFMYSKRKSGNIFLK